MTSPSKTSGGLIDVLKFCRLQSRATWRDLSVAARSRQTVTLTPPACVRTGSARKRAAELRAEIDAERAGNVALRGNWERQRQEVARLRARLARTLIAPACPGSRAGEGAARWSTSRAEMLARAEPRALACVRL